jgi:hypothetical protein
MRIGTLVAGLLGVVLAGVCFADAPIVGYGQARLGMSEQEFVQLGIAPLASKKSYCGQVDGNFADEPGRRCYGSDNGRSIYQFDPALSGIEVNVNNNAQNDVACKAEMDSVARVISRKYGQFDFLPQRQERDGQFNGAPVHWVIWNTERVVGNRKIVLEAQAEVERQAPTLNLACFIRVRYLLLKDNF